MARFLGKEKQHLACLLGCEVYSGAALVFLFFFYLGFAQSLKKGLTKGPLGFGKYLFLFARLLKQIQIINPFSLTI